MSNLTITLFQFDIFWEDKKNNLSFIEKSISEIETDLLVLPEMFSTGFTMNPNDFYESMNGETINWMKKISNQKNLAICGSIIIKENERFFNRFIFVDKDEVKFYDKRHLFSYAGENINYNPGDSKVIINYKGWRINPLICYDLRFPVWSRNTNDYDLLLYVANWPEKRSSHWKNLLTARSIENQCYVVAVNRIGKDNKDLSHCGDSMVLDPLGNELTHLDNNFYCTNVILNKEKISSIRKEFPFLNDKDDFIINN